VSDTITSTDISDWIVGRIEFYGRVEAGSFDVDTPLTELGLDSIYALSLCADIEDTYGLPIDPMMFEDYPTIRALADALAERLPEG
jgi:acyl carrier protein